MKLFSGRMLAIAPISALMAILPCIAQNPKSPDTANGPATGTPAPEQQPTPAGKIIFQRSLDANGNTVSTTGPAANSGAHAVDAPVVEDADRAAIAITALDLDVHLNTEQQQIAVRGLVTVRNSGKAGLQRIPLQLSSSLNWERIRVEGKDASFPVATLNSDSDHTGQLHEAALQLSQPLAPGATQQIEVFYSGTITATARRLTSVGTPEASAAHSDWDVISSQFTGLRGFGNVVWYPVASLPVILGDGARLFDEIGRQKLHAEGSRFRLRLTVEFPHGQTPTVAVADGKSLKLNVTDTKTLSEDIPGVATADSGTTTLSFESPSLFVTTLTAHPGKHTTVFAPPENELAAKTWVAATIAVSPMIERWLGSDSRTQLTVLDLPDPDDLPWETGPFLAIPVHDAPPDQIDSVLAHAMTHAWMSPSPYWLDEGAANFMGTMWDDHQHKRDRALATLEGGRPALAIAEPPSPGEAQGQPLITAISPVYYRTKAAYILWMLRDIVGDDALGAALRQSNAATEKTSDEKAQAFQAGLKSQSPAHDLKWLFADWIDADNGLPDLAVDKVFPNAVQAGNWLVSITISNSGYAGVVVPVTIRSATNTTTENVFVPARGTVTPRLLVQGKPTEAQVNDGTVPETQATVHVLHLDQSADAQPLPETPHR
jgi:hypothetical protein